jgi:hypothetical protein
MNRRTPDFSGNIADLKGRQMATVDLPALFDVAIGCVNG